MLDISKIASHVDKARQVATEVREKAEQAVDGARASVTHGGVDNISKEQIDLLTAELASTKSEKERLYDRIYNLESEKREIQKSKNEELSELRETIARRDDRISELVGELAVIRDEVETLRAAADIVEAVDTLESEGEEEIDDWGMIESSSTPPTFRAGEDVDVSLTATEERILFFAATKWLMGKPYFSKPSNSTGPIQKLVDKGLLVSSNAGYVLTEEGVQAARMRLTD